jgi:hypothetical protein
MIMMIQNNIGAGQCIQHVFEKFLLNQGCFYCFSFFLGHLKILIAVNKQQLQVIKSLKGISYKVLDLSSHYPFLGPPLDNLK